MILGLLQKRKPLGQTARKRNLFDLQKEYCALGTQTLIADIDNRFCREIEKSTLEENCFVLSHCHHPTSCSLVLVAIR